MDCVIASIDTRPISLLIIRSPTIILLFYFFHRMCVTSRKRIKTNPSAKDDFLMARCGGAGCFLLQKKCVLLLFDMARAAILEVILQRENRPSAVIRD